MVFKVAYPDYIMNDTLMNDIYKTVNFACKTLLFSYNALVCLYL